MHFGGWLTTDDHGGGFEMAETKGVVLATIGVGALSCPRFQAEYEWQQWNSFALLVL